MVFTFNIEIDISKTDDFQDLVFDCDCLLSSFYDSRQIINDDFQIVQSARKLIIPVVCPEKSSLKPENSSEYALNWVKVLEEKISTKIKFIETGIEPQYTGYELPEKSTFYILHFRSFSPLICGDTKNAIPLYKIPFTYHDNKCYNDIRSWERNYESCMGLWMRGSVGERFALDQMQNVNSALNREGIKITKRIEELTSIPTFYFLFNYRGWSKKQDLNRKCPITNKNWLIENSSDNDLFSFKCDESRLVSELSNNAR